MLPFINHLISQNAMKGKSNNTGGPLKEALHAFPA